ncbi:MAG: CarD family transcriptional regulator, partial [Peptococcaceae bacterium]|nr:CarD family transcriptional regulator [Peptococcaceae bacterium]
MQFSILGKLGQIFASKNRQVILDGLDASGRLAFCELLLKNQQSGPVIIICANDKRVQTLCGALRQGVTLPVYALYESSIMPVEVLAKEESEGDAVCALQALSSDQSCVVVCNVMALSLFYPRRSYFMEAVFSLAVGEVQTQEDFLARLYALGYEASSICDQPGVFAKRGGIVDVYPLNQDSPIRVEWFDDEIDSIRLFSSETQKSEKNIDTVTIVPAKLHFFSEALQQELHALVLEEAADLEGKIDAQAYQDLRSRLSRMADSDDQQLLAYYAYLLDAYRASIFDYLPAATTVVLDDAESLEETLNEKLMIQSHQTVDLFEGGYILPSKQQAFVDATTIRQALSDFHSFSLSEIATQETTKGGASVFYPIKSSTLKPYPVQKFIQDIKRHLEDQYTLIFYHEDGEVLTLLANLFDEYALAYEQVDAAQEKVKASAILLLHQHFSFECDFSGDRVLFMNANIFNVQSKHQVESHAKPAKKHKGLLVDDLQVGDYIVHENHGVGLYLGIEHLKTDTIERDYLLIQYKGSDRLYVPIDQLQLVDKYVGQEGKRPKVNKLGGPEWLKTKSRIRKSIEEMAEQLLEVHAKREMRPGFAFAPDDELQREFEADFPYVETVDQLAAIEDVKRDMERPLSMDRLICGDVGFGKTEVALRAAFKAVCNHKQVAVLVPTTILAMQHYETFSERMKEYGVEVALLTRFCTTKEQNKIFKGI